MAWTGSRGYLRAITTRPCTSASSRWTATSTAASWFEACCAGAPNGLLTTATSDISGLFQMLDEEPAGRLAGGDAVALAAVVERPGHQQLAVRADEVQAVLAHDLHQGELGPFLELLDLSLLPVQGAQRFHGGDLSLAGHDGSGGLEMAPAPDGVLQGHGRRRLALLHQLPERPLAFDQVALHVEVAVDLVEPEVLAADQHGDVADLSLRHRQVVVDLGQVVERDLIGVLHAPALSRPRGLHLEDHAAVVGDAAIDVGEHPGVARMAHQVHDRAHLEARAPAVLGPDDVLEQLAPEHRLGLLEWRRQAGLLLPEVVWRLPGRQAQRGGGVGASYAGSALLWRASVVHVST